MKYTTWDVNARVGETSLEAVGMEDGRTNMVIKEADGQCSTVSLSAKLGRLVLHSLGASLGRPDAFDFAIDEGDFEEA